MLTYQQALESVLANAETLPEKEMPLKKLLGHFLARPVTARMPLPPFDNSAVDGFGVRLSDTLKASDESPRRLKLIGEIKAGSSKEVNLEAGSTVKILTGARVPPSVEAVIMREFCQEKDGYVLFNRSASHLENIRRAGAEFSQGAQIFPAGVRITPPVVGMLANLGYRSFAAHEKPRAALVVTGDELVPPGRKLAPGQIYDSNSFTLQAALTEFGITTQAIIHAPDTRKATKQAFRQAIEEADLVISSGGVSVGDHDYVKAILEELKVRTIFWQVAIKPGKPVYFGVLEPTAGRGKRLIFGLPGNPVSVLVTFLEFVKPALRKIMGAQDPLPPAMTARNMMALRKKAGRLDFVRGIVSCAPTGELQVKAARGQDSHMLSGLAMANSLIHFPREDEELAPGSLIPIHEISWHD